MNHDLILCGWRVRSALPLPELLPWLGGERPVDVEISLGNIPERSDAPVFVLPHSKLWGDGAFLLALDGVGRFWVEGGRRVVVQAASGIEESELKAFLLGSVLGVLCHQRDLLPIHASAVRINGRAVLIAGISGAGKSTLAAALGVRGHALAADDIAAFDPASGMILPAFPQRKLARDALEALALEQKGLVPNRPGQPKFYVHATEGFDPAPLPPLAVYLLVQGTPASSGTIEHRPTTAAMAALDRMIYRRVVGMKIQAQQALFGSIVKLAQAAPVHRIAQQRGLPLTLLDQLAERVESHALGLLEK
jgi:hypothetical protein